MTLKGRIGEGQTQLMRLAADNQYIPDALGRQPSTPTKAQPGTPSKVAVLAARALAGEPLWGDDDLNTLPTSEDLAYNRTAMHTPERYGKCGMGRTPTTMEK